MCVIASAEENRLTDDQVESMFDANDAGAGIAWREDGVVKWEKGLELKDIQKKCAEVPLPYVAHFRIPTCGGRIPYLCHPFPIDKSASLSLKGTTKGYVLFHNGHWGTWRGTSMSLAIANKLQLPGGRWSDSRAMAWVASHLGLGALEMMDEVCVAFGPDQAEYYGTRWSEIDKAGIWVSNRSWESINTWKQTNNKSKADNLNLNLYGGSSLCKYKTCNKFQYGNSGYCFEHVPHVSDKEVGAEGDAKAGPFRGSLNSTDSKQDKQDSVQKAEKKVREGTVEKSDETITALVLVDKREQEALKWAKALNPKPFRLLEDAAERNKRALDKLNGIEIVGPM